MVGNISVTESGTIGNPIVITAANGFTPDFSDNITLTGDYVQFSYITISGNLNMVQPTTPSVTYCTFTGSGEKMTLSFPRNDWEGQTWTIDYNNYVGMSSGATINGYRKSLWRAVFSRQFDINSSF